MEEKFGDERKKNCSRPESHLLSHHMGELINVKCSFTNYLEARCSAGSKKIHGDCTQEKSHKHPTERENASTKLT